MRIHVRLIAIVLLSLVISTTVYASQKFNSIYVFGDSLSDAGNLALVVGDYPDPPYYDNRASNGPVAVEVLADKLGLNADASEHVLGGLPAGTNYAIATARAGGTNLEDLSSQVAAYLAFKTPLPDDLFVILAGGNDLRDARSEFNPLIVQQIINNAVKGIKSATETLIAAGAKHIMVVNAPDIGLIPETRIGADYFGIPWLTDLTTLRSKVFNLKLYFALRSVEWRTGKRIIKFNLFNHFTNIINNPNEFSLSNVTDPCYRTVRYEPPEVILNEDVCLVDNVIQLDNFFFIDEIHSTAKVNEVIGNAMYQAVMAATKRKHLVFKF